MKTFYILAAITVSILCSSEQIARAQNQRGPVLVELFTSEGCSSCPPADEAVKEIASEYKSNLYIIGFHVDYWDRLGWKDAYSDAAYTNRQQRYAHFLGLTNIYTPQVIINGSTQLVGSDKILLQKTINEEMKKNGSAIINLKAHTSDNKSVNVAYRITTVSGKILNIALVQLQAYTDVKSGENSGKQLRHMNIVREFKTIDMPKEIGNMIIPLPKELPLKNFRVVVFLQDKNNWHIEGVAEAGIDYLPVGRDQ